MFFRKTFHKSLFLGFISFLFVYYLGKFYVKEVLRSSTSPVSFNKVSETPGLDVQWMWTEDWPKGDGFCQSLLITTNLHKFLYPKDYHLQHSNHEKELNSVLKSKKLKRLHIAGHIGFPMYYMQQLIYYLMANQSHVKTICEVGFNAGHSALQFLTGNPTATVYSFEYGKLPYTRPMTAYLQKTFPGRLKMIWGDSKRSVPYFIRRNPNVKCDLITIDGNHNYPEVKFDIVNFSRLANKFNAILMDDMHHPQILHAWNETLYSGLTKEVHRCQHQTDFTSYKSSGTLAEQKGQKRTWRLNRQGLASIESE